MGKPKTFRPGSRGEIKLLHELFARIFFPDGSLAGNFRSQAGCQPAIQPITNRRYLAAAYSQALPSTSLISSCANP